MAEEVLHQLAVPLLVLDEATQCVVYANPAATRRLGRSQKELRGTALAKLLVAGDQAAWIRLLSTAAPEAVAARSRWLLRHPDGAEVAVFVGPLLPSGHRVVWAPAQPPDRPGEESWEEDDLTAFAFSAFHDFKEPLQLVRGFLRLARKRPHEDPVLDEHLAAALASTERMQRLVASLLEHFRVRSTALHPEPVSMEHAVAEALATLRLRILEAGASVEVEQMPVLHGDRLRLVRLFENLIGNAIKFHGEEPPHVRIGARFAKGAWEFFVADNGIGVPEGERQAVLRPFHRLHSVDRYQGSGLGLSTCRAIVEAHKGTIWLEGAPTGGTVVRFTLPGDAA